MPELSDRLREKLATLQPEAPASDRLSSRLRSELATRAGGQPDATGAAGRRTRGMVARSGPGRSETPGVAAGMAATGISTFLERLAKKSGDALLSVPDAAIDIVAGAETALEAVPGAFSDRGLDLRNRYQQNRDEYPNIPRYTIDELIASGRANLALLPGGASPGEQYRWSMENAAEREEQQNRDHPFASGAGDFGGNVFAMIASKRPLNMSIRNLENSLMNPTARETAEGFARVMDDALKSNAARLPMRGLFRAGETGLEAAWLEALSEAENDPVLAAGLGAGTQLASSGSLTMLKSMLEGGPKEAALKLSLAAISTAGIWQMVKSSTPNGRDRILESIETGYDKVSAGLILGALGGLAGGRGRDLDISRHLPEIVEGFSSVPRTRVLTAISNFAEAPPEEQAAFESVLNELTADPDYQGDSELERRIVEQLRTGLAAEEPETEPEEGSDRGVRGGRRRR